MVMAIPLNSIIGDFFAISLKHLGAVHSVKLLNFSDPFSRNLINQLRGKQMAASSGTRVLHQLRRNEKKANYRFQLICLRKVGH